MCWNELNWTGLASLDQCVVFKLITNEEIEMLEEMKLLGVIITSNLKWRSNTKYITERGYSRLWILKRLKRLGCPIEDLLDTYMKQVRCLLEMACPVWHPALTVADSKAIERVQKSALSIILGDEYISYDSALDDLNLETLVARRDSLCLKFAMKSAAHPTHSQWFKSTGDAPDTRNRNLYQPVWTQWVTYEELITHIYIHNTMWLWIISAGACQLPSLSS